MDFSEAVDGLVLCLAFAGGLTLLRTLFVIAYLPFHLALNRKGVSMEAREPGMSWIGPGLRILIGVIAVAVVIAFGV